MPALLMGAKPLFVKAIVSVPSTGGGIVVVASVVVQNSWVVVASVVVKVLCFSIDKER